MRPRSGTVPALALALALGLAAGGCGEQGYSSLDRGDRLLARGEAEAALAEYRLARRQRGEEIDVLLRLAHAHARRGDVGAAIEGYRRLVARDSSWRHQAALALTEAAREALERHGPDRMARTLEPLVAMGASLVPSDLRLELARHLAERQAFDRALPLLLSIEGRASGDTASGPGAERDLLTARAYQELGGCRQALPYFERYLQGEEGGTAGRGGARWHYGSCLYEVAQRAWRDGRRRDALERVDRLIELGAPRTLMDRAHFLRGDLLAEGGRHEEALAAFEQVLRLNPARTGPLARSAQERVREIRYRETAASDTVSPSPRPPR